MIDEMLRLSGQHLRLTLLAMVLAVAMGVPLAVWLHRRERWRGPVLMVVNILQTVPSLALFGFLIPLLGIGPVSAVFALVAYALLPVVRGTLTGLMTVDLTLLESGDALGMTDRERLRWVELPLAAPQILNGIRVATVATVGTATIAAAIGAGGLGELIFRGVATVDSRQILAGACPAAALALALDGGFAWLERSFFRR